MTVNKLLPGNETILAVPVIEVNGIAYLAGPTSLEPLTAATTATLNYWASVVNEGCTGFGAGGNISAALVNDVKLGLDASATDKDRDLIAVGDTTIATYFKATGSLNIFRDADLTAQGAFNMARNLFRAPDIPYALVQRIGVPQDTPFAVGDDVDIWYFWTDNPVPVYADADNQLVTQNLITKNQVNVAYTLTA
jgi:hypothetical protein